MTNEKDFKLERYKYILQQIHFLNQSLYKHLAFFRGLSVLLLGGIVAILVNWEKLELTHTTAQLGIYSLLLIHCLAALFVTVLVISGIFSWVDYRNEEADLLDETIEQGYRSRPKLRNFWRWHETWLLLFVILFTVITSAMTHYYLIPTIR
jgi:uncharacterized iron-regulated membrane protein